MAAEARTRGFQAVFITDGVMPNQYAALPPFWGKELQVGAPAAVLLACARARVRARVRARARARVCVCMSTRVR